MTDKPAEFSENNYYLLNEAVNREAELANAALLRKEIDNSRAMAVVSILRFAKYGLVAILVALSIMVLAWAYQIFNTPGNSHQTLDINTELDVTGVESVKSAIELAIEDTVSRLDYKSFSNQQYDSLLQEVAVLKEILHNNNFDKEAIRELIEKNTSKEPNESTVTTNFTVFVTEEISGGSVVTGKEYSPKNLLTPNKQYCYYEYLLVGKRTIEEIGNKISGNTFFEESSPYVHLSDFCRFE